MPYIAQAYRDKLDPYITQLADALAAEVVDEENELAYAGLLNYAITRTSLLVIKNLFGTKLKYMNIALLTGIMENVKQEFYERLGTEVERDRRRANGDVDVIEDFQEELTSLI